MSLATIITALVHVAADAVSARQAFVRLPAGQPIALPAVIVQWTSTEPEAATHSARGADGKLVRRGKKRTHKGTIYALLSDTGNAPYEDDAALAAAQALVDGIEADATLRGTGSVDKCALCELDIVRRDTREIDGVVYAGIQAGFEVTEL